MLRSSNRLAGYNIPHSIMDLSLAIEAQNLMFWNQLDNRCIRVKTVIMNYKIKLQLK